MKIFQKISFSKFNIPIRLLFADYFLGLAAFTMLRISFLIFNHIAASAVSVSLLVESFWRGIQFDSVACGMILALPWLISFFGMFFKRHEVKFRIIVSLVTNLFFIFAFFVAFVDMPLFAQFGKRISVAALSWSSSPGFILRLIFSSWRFIALIILFVGFSYLFYRIRKKNARRISNSNVFEISKIKSVGVSIFCGGLLLLAIRGRVSLKSPIKWGTAYFCTNTFANQLVLNPFYTFITSTIESSTKKKIDYHVMDDKIANEIIQRSFGRTGEQIFQNNIEGDSSAPKRNVIIVVMESMAGWKTGLFPNGLHWTPCLDSLSKEGIFFSRFYSDGIHTFNGLYSTLTGNQALPKIHPLADINIDYNPISIADLLKAKGYSTTFFTTHDAEFDNMNGFMRGNGYDEVIGEPDYKISTGMNPMGVPDHLMFDFAGKKISEMAKTNKPFFVSFMTGSDHEPFKIPDNISFANKGNDDHENATRYADWSIGQFMKACKKEKWCDNTIFVFVADHGGIPLEHNNDMYLAFHHIPCIIIGPGISPSTNSSLGTQADVLPTIMGLLRFRYVNSSMGIDLLMEKRKRIYFSYDEEVGVLDTNSFYVQRAIDPHLFLLNENEFACIRSEDSIQIKQDQEYLAAMLQLLDERFYGKVLDKK